MPDKKIIKYLNERDELKTMEDLQEKLRNIKDEVSDRRMKNMASTLEYVATNPDYKEPKEFLELLENITNMLMNK